MTAAATERFEQYLDPITTVERRFAIELVDFDVTTSTVVMSMPVHGLTNPVTGFPTLSPLAIVLDDVGGRTNHLLREADEWTMTSELTLELGPAGLLSPTVDPQDRLVATARTIGREGPTAVAVCEVLRGGIIIGSATVRSYFVSADQVGPEPPDDSPRGPRSTLAELMGVHVRTAEDGTPVLMQQPNSAINNRMGVVHGGVASAGVELAASAAINIDGPYMATASLRVNFLRPFVAGAHSRYAATPLRIGRTSAVVDAQAIGDDGRTAIVARVTAYR